MDDWKQDYNWLAAFEYAGGQNSNSNYVYGEANIITLDGSDIASFDVGDVVEVYASEEGENDGPSWIMWGLLKDGRSFFLSAGCDYTGWDCQAGGCAYVSMDKDRLIHSAMDIGDRRRLGLPSAGDE